MLRFYMLLIKRLRDSDHPRILKTQILRALKVSALKRMQRNRLTLLAAFLYFLIKPILRGSKCTLTAHIRKKRKNASSISQLVSEVKAKFMSSVSTDFGATSRIIFLSSL